MIEISQVGTENCRTSVDLYVRSLCPAGGHSRQERILDRLERLDEANHIAGFTVTVWGERVPREGRTPTGERVLERLDAFRAWSDRAGTSLTAFFETRETGSLVAAEPRPAIVLPMVCMVEYHGDDLQYVTPCVDSGRACTVLDRLDALEGDLRDNE